MEKIFQFEIRAVEEGDRRWIMDMISENWGADFVVIHEEVFYPHKLPGFIVRTPKAEVVGLVTYHIHGDVCEIITVNSLQEDQGVGSMLIDIVIEEARKSGCSRLCLTTTNDNQRAIDFYQKRGFLVREVRKGAVDRARLIKPSIPQKSSQGIPIRDEWEFELILPGPKDIVLAFNERINSRDLAGLEAMMTEDHTFIDSSNEVHPGKDLMVAGWKEFFESYPDYKNHFTYLENRGDRVYILGHSTCSHKPLDGPAIWTARVVGERVAEWRVYLDTEDNRKILELPTDL